MCDDTRRFGGVIAIPQFVRVADIEKLSTCIPPPVPGIFEQAERKGSHMVSNRMKIFFRYIHSTYGLSAGQLQSIINNSTAYSAMFRAAALRNLTCGSPVEITGGWPYAARRRAVRAHYNF
jgi:hypothetical protein